MNKRTMTMDELASVWENLPGARYFTLGTRGKMKCANYYPTRKCMYRVFPFADGESGELGWPRSIFPDAIVTLHCSEED